MANVLGYVSTIYGADITGNANILITWHSVKIPFLTAIEWLLVFVVTMPALFLLFVSNYNLCILRSKYMPVYMGIHTMYVCPCIQACICMYAHVYRHVYIIYK